MFLTDVNNIVNQMVETGVLGLTAAAILYAAFALATRKRFAAPIATHALRFLFCAYALCVLLLTLVPSAGHEDASLRANLTPLSSVLYAIDSGWETAQYLIVLNILMFIPLGIFLPSVFKRVNRLWKAAAISFCATLFIELVQMALPGRAFDIDDILMNTLGGVIGYAMFAVCIWIFQRKAQKCATKIASLAVLAVIPVFLGVCALTAGPRGLQYSFMCNPWVPADIRVTETPVLPASAMIYQRNPGAPQQRIAGLMDAFGLTGHVEEAGGFLVNASEKGQLSVSMENEIWYYWLRETNHTPAALSDAQLQEQAQALLEHYGLWGEYLAFDYAGDILMSFESMAAAEELGCNEAYTESDTGEVIAATGRKVSFRTADDSHVGTVTVSFDGDGIYEIWSELETLYPYQETELLPVTEALEMLARSGRCYMASGEIIKPQSAKIDRVSLIYVDSLHRDYRLPAWRLEGIFYGEDLHGNATQTQRLLDIPAI